METNVPNKFLLQFKGKGTTYFSIVIINWLLTIITLGFYYPWAKAKQLKYIYGSTTLNGDNFAFHGTGREMFLGLFKTMVVLFVIIAILLGCITVGYPILGIIFFYLVILSLFPLMIHGSYRYRMSRTTWRGIRFGYRGNKWVLYKNIMIWMFLTIITLGLYSFWMDVKMRKYLSQNTRVGDASFSYSGRGETLFLIFLKGYFLTLITFGIYSFWWQKDIIAFYINNMTVEHNNTRLHFKSTATAEGIFILFIVNLFLLIFTLGLGFAWVRIRTIKYFTEHIELTGDLNINALKQTEENYKNAIGEEMLDFFDIDLI